MFTKIITVAGIVMVVGIAYFFIIVIMPFIADMSSTANTTIAATSNMSNYPGLSGGLLGAPLFLYFVPAITGIILVIITLRRPIGA